MPFLCARHRDSEALKGGAIQLAPPDCPGRSWRALEPAAASPFEIWYASPCSIWRGSVMGASCRLLCDGFVSGPRGFDAINTSPDPYWLVEELARRGCRAMDGLKGQFALCFVNDEADELIVVRDRLGGKPLYWFEDDHIAAVGTRSADLAGLAPGALQENPGFISEMFALRGRHSPRPTPFRKVHDVLPGARSTCNAGAIQATRPPFGVEPPRCRSADDWVALFAETFETAVNDALGEKGGVGVMLSGGMDSIPVMTAASCKLRTQNRVLQAISWILPGYPESDESLWIEAAAEAAGVTLKTFDGAASLPFSRLDSSLVSPELPYFNPMRELLLKCHSLAADTSCSLQLAATQGDMIYAGRHRVMQDLINRGEWKRLGGELAYLYQSMGLQGIYRDPAVRYPLSRLLRRIPAYSGAARTDWMTDYATSQLPADVPWPPEGGELPNPEHAYAMLGPAMTFGPAQENEFAQRFGVERRDPFQNEALVALMLHAPVFLSHTRGRTKWIMREAMRDRIPDSLRLKGRTGLLTQFINSGYARNREHIERFLFELRRAAWQRYVHPGFVKKALSDGSPSSAGLMTICGCIGYSLWREHWTEA